MTVRLPLPAGEGCTRGGGTGGGAGRAIPGTTQALPGTHIQSYLAIKPYLRPNEGNSHVFHEVSQDGSKNGSRIDQN